MNLVVVVNQHVMYATQNCELVIAVAGVELKMVNENDPAKTDCSSHTIPYWIGSSPALNGVKRMVLSGSTAAFNTLITVAACAVQRC